MNHPYLLFLFFTLGLASSQAQVTPELTSQLVERSGLSGGLLLIPRCREIEAAIELADKTAFIVFAQSTEEKQVSALKKLASQRNLLSRKFYVEKGSSTNLPLADNSVSLLLIDDLLESDLNPNTRQAWLRAISPRRGVAIIGHHQAAEFDAKKVRNWLAEAADQLEVQMLSVDGGAFALIRKAAPAGADVWSHKFHDASNQRFSRDSSLKAPFAPAWYALPTNLGYWGDSCVSAGGRAYYIWANRSPNTSVSLICFDIHNGCVLWEQPFNWEKAQDKNRGGYYPGRSCMIAQPDGLLLVDGDRVRKIDGESGRELGGISGPKAGGQIKWFGAEGDLLAVLAGEADHFDTSTLQQIAVNPYGHELAVYQISSGKCLWRRTEEGPVDEREIALLQSKLYVHARDQRLSASELATGELIWENRESETLKLLSTPAEKKIDHAKLISCRILTATDRVLYFSSAIRPNKVALNRLNGKLLWSEPLKLASWRRSVSDVLFDGWVNKDNKTYDLFSHEEVDKINVPSSGCGPSFTTPEFFITAFGQVGTRDGQTLREADLKNSCDLGVVIADGVAFSPPGICLCGTPIHGYRAFTTQPSPPLGKGMAQLQLGPAISKALGPALDAGEWNCWRGDHRHSGSLAIQAPRKLPELSWQWKPTIPNPVPLPLTGYGARALDIPEHLPTQAVSAAGLTVFADHQGVVRALSLKDGKELWSYAIGAKLNSPPALAQGRVVLGAMDGYVVCLDAASGQLAWRYRVPVNSRRIFWYGHLIDAQPLIGGALVYGDTVYAVAGFQSGYGVRAVALDLASGEAKWSREVSDPSVSSLGAMTIAAGKLFIQSGGQIMTSFDLDSGEPQSLDNIKFAADSRWGKDLAAVSDDWLLYGGRRVYTNINRWLTPSRGMGYSLGKTDRQVDKDSPQKILGVELVADSCLMPVFDDELFVAFNEYAGRRTKPDIQAWKLKELLGKAAHIDKPTGGQRNLLNKKALFGFGSLLTNKSSKLPSDSLWKDVELAAFAAVLCDDALIVLHPKGEKNKFEGWQLSALERQDGALRWGLDLPSRPAWDGLSLASDGSILVALWDGSLVRYIGL